MVRSAVRKLNIAGFILNNRYVCPMLRQVNVADKNCVPTNVLRHVFAWNVFCEPTSYAFFLFLIDL